MFTQRIVRTFIALQMVGVLAFSMVAPVIPVANAASNPAKNCPLSDGTWVKVDAGSGNASGVWGQIDWQGSEFNFSLSDGYTMDVCVKSGSKAFDDTSPCIIDVDNDKVCYYNGKSGDGSLAGI